MAPRETRLATTLSNFLPALAVLAANRSFFGVLFGRAAFCSPFFFFGEIVAHGRVRPPFHHCDSPGFHHGTTLLTCQAIMAPEEEAPRYSAFRAFFYTSEPTCRFLPKIADRLCSNCMRVWFPIDFFNGSPQVLLPISITGSKTSFVLFRSSYVYVKFPLTCIKGFRFFSPSASLVPPPFTFRACFPPT